MEQLADYQQDQDENICFMFQVNIAAKMRGYDHTGATSLHNQLHP